MDFWTFSEAGVSRDRHELLQAERVLLVPMPAAEIEAKLIEQVYRTQP